MHLRMPAALAAALALACGGPALGQDDPRIDADTGRDAAVYPPPRHFDHLHMRLELDIPTMDEPKARAVQTLRVTPIGSPRGELVLDAKGFEIESVTAGGIALEFSHLEDQVKIRFPAPVALGTEVEVVTTYALDYTMNNGLGLTWTPGREGSRSETDQWAQIHSQGQPDFSRTWFPCQDFPNERMTTELLVTVDSEYQVCSNGRLVRSRRADDTRTTWHWLQDKPHAAYLVVLVIGKFAIVGLDTRDAGLSRPIPVYLYAPLGSERSAKAAYASTPAMLAFFEKTFDEPYPWDKYAQLLVRNFAAGGMENTSATTMQASSAYTRPGSQDDIIAHEAAHQWTGDLLTCKSWEHAWLNEGWASMGEALWFEHRAQERDGTEAARRAYQGKIAEFLSVERAMNRTFAPRYPALASNRYNTPFEVFVRPNNIYSKGAIVLHMLRMRLGDETFFRGVRAYIDRYKFQEVETDDFRMELERASGLSLEQFFDQWVFRPGLPRLHVWFEWDEEASSLSVTLNQTQKVDGDNPAYDLRVPLYVEFADGEGEYVHLETSTTLAEHTFELRGKPVDVRVDPYMSNAATVSIRKPLAMWMRQVEDASVFMRLQAVEHLARFDDQEARGALARLASEDGQEGIVKNRAASAWAAAHVRLAASRLMELGSSRQASAKEAR